MLTIVALAILMGRQRPADFLRLAQQLNAKQREVLGYYWPPGKKARVAPGRDIFYSLLSRVDPTALAGGLERVAPNPAWPTARRARPRWQSGHRPSRTSRPSGRPGYRHQGRSSPVLTVSKEHEAPEARALLAQTELDGALVSLDAGHANQETARTIVEAGGEYLIQLKGNAPAVEAAAAHAVQGQAPLFSPTTATMAAPSIVT